MRTAGELHKLGILTLIDGDALAAYCDSWSQWSKARDFLKKHGFTFTIKGDDGKTKCVQQWPQVSIYNKMLAALRQYQQEFGLTPSSRSAIKVNANAGEDELESFAKQKHA